MNDDLSCAACRASLPEYAAGAAAPALQAQITAHLARCAACRAEAAQWAAIIAAQRHTQPGDIPPPLSLARVMAGVRAQLPPAQRAPRAQKGTSVMQPSLERSTTDHASFTTRRSPRRFASIIGSLAAVALIALVAQLLFARLNAPASEGGPARGVTAAELRTFTLRAVSFATPADGWAVGGTMPLVARGQVKAVIPILLHYQQGNWYNVPLVGLHQRPLMLTSVAMVSPDEGWAVGGTQYVTNGVVIDGYIAGYILHFHQGSWTIVQEIPNAKLWQITMLSATDGWAVGDRLVLHFDGYHWNPVTDPAFADISFSAAAAGSSTNVWLAGTFYGGLSGNDSNAPEKVLHFDGKSWKTDTFDSIRFNALAVGAPDLAGAVGWGPGAPNRKDPSLPKSNELGEIYIFDTTAQNVYGEGEPINGLQHSIGYSDIAFATPIDGYITGAGGLIIHLQYTSLVDRHGGSAGVVPSPTHHDLYGITMLSPTDGWIVGDAGTILHLTHGTWRMFTP